MAAVWYLQYIYQGYVSLLVNQMCKISAAPAF